MVTAYRQPDAVQISKEDQEQLGLLPVLFYCYAVLFGLVALAIAFLAVVPAILVAAAPRQASDAPPLFVGGILLVVFGSIALVLLAKAVLMVLAGRAIGRRQGHTLAMVAACLAIPNFPLGSALGIFAIVVLQRPSVKALFVG